MTTTFDIGSLGTVLGVWAHPDDEIFLSAGLMASAARAGQRVVCVTATVGERGTAEPEKWPPRRLGPVRAREQHAALQLLGITQHAALGYPDGACAQVPMAEAARQIAAIVDIVRPDTVLTFGEDGMTGHPDHVAVGRWTSLAVTFSRHRPRILHAAVTPAESMRQRSVNEALGAFAPGYPRTTPAADLALRLLLDDELLDLKLAALRKHASQTREQEHRVGTAAYRLWQREEAFVPAHAPEPVAPVCDRTARSGW